MKRLSVLVLIFSAHVLAAPLNEELRRPETSQELTELTRSAETFNKVDLLDRGQNSWPVRRGLLERASSFVFVSVPFWNYDQAGREFVDMLAARKQADRAFELKVIQGWTSPWLSKGGRKVKGELKDVADQYLLWNSPLWQRRFSFNLFRGHVHDKFLIVDGNKMVLGGMNISNEDAGGGSSMNGTHDTDLVIEGPVVHQATEIFLKVNQLGHHLNSSKSFPPFKDLEIKAFQNFFYDNVEDHDFTTVTDEPNPKPPFTKTHRVHIPIKKLLASPKYFPQVDSGDVSVRLIYDNPLIDRDPRTKKHYSKFFRTLSFLARKARHTIWISTPYLTFDRELMALFQEAAKRVEVRILTNSIETTDRGTNYYKSQVSHYPAMLKAGIRVFEWKGHGGLYKVNHECPVTYWPGQMLHSKLVLIDNAVSMVGSNNINRRSKLLNNEVMVLLNDEPMSRRVGQIFETAFAGEIQRLSCRDGSSRGVTVVEEMTKEKVDALTRRLGVKEPEWDYAFGGL